MKKIKNKTKKIIIIILFQVSKENLEKIHKKIIFQIKKITNRINFKTANPLRLLMKKILINF